MGGVTIHSAVKSRRSAAGMSQAELARRTSVSRQTISSLEAGRYAPSTVLSLRLASALDCRVEDLFSLEDGREPIAADFVPADGCGGANAGSRVALARVAGNWVAHPIGAEAGEVFPGVADGLAVGAAQKDATGSRIRVEPLRSRRALGANLLAVGCDPALAILSGWLAERSPGLRLHCAHAPSVRALELLAAGRAHLAGTHLLDEASGDYNVPFVRRRFHGRPMLVVNLARFETGFVVAPGNPKAIRRADDLARRRVRVVPREPGAEAQRLLERLLREARISRSALQTSPPARGHFAVARTIAAGAADVGIATRGAAQAFGLGFVPLAEERSDLVLPRELFDDSRFQRLIDTLGCRPFRRELASLGGYGTAESGHVVAEVRGA